MGKGKRKREERVGARVGFWARAGEVLELGEVGFLYLYRDDAETGELLPFPLFLFPFPIFLPFRP
jgi:hypothetical protein